MYVYTVSGLWVRASSLIICNAHSTRSYLEGGVFKQHGVRGEDQQIGVLTVPYLLDG